MRYRIRVQGHLDPSWEDRFVGWRIEQQNAREVKGRRR